MRIAITGATGFIGVPLVQALRARGDEVIALVRDPERARHQLPDVELVRADLETKGEWTAVFGRVDAIAHLAGERIADERWNARKKQRIRDSRVESTRTIVEALASLASRPAALVTASGVDYYPFSTGPGEFDDDPVTESDPPSDSFLGRLCRDWENEARPAEKLGVRVVSLRTGLVFGSHGGALDKLKRAFKLFAGGRIGSGRQFVSWVHLDDVVAAYIAALSDERYRGPINLVTSSVRNAELADVIGSVLHKPSWLPVPAFALKVVVGSELAESILNGRNVVPAKLRELGFSWKHPDLAEALASALRD
jgi:uncharacterized protein